jgi:TPR repeat protein
MHFLLGLILTCPLPVLAFTDEAIECYQAIGANSVDVAISLCLVAAQQGDMQAQYKVAVLYARSGTQASIPESLKWLEKAAKRGHTDAQYNLGFANRAGNGVLVDYDQALTWYRLASQGGSAKAQRDIALMYENGAGVPLDQEQAFFWYRKSAEQGLAASQLKVGVMLLEGQGAEADVQLAEEWIRLAAVAGEVDAQFVLGSFLWKIDAKESEEWYRRAIEQNHQYAMFSLARSLYVDSRDESRVTEELERALTVASKAVISGHTESVRLYNAIAVSLETKRSIDELSPEVVIEATSEIQQKVDSDVAVPSPKITEVMTERVLNAQADESINPWFSKLSPEHYTIQLVVSSSLLGVEEFIKKHGMVGTAQFHATKRQEKLIYIVTFGDYLDHAMATTALQDLPASLSEVSAFVQKISILQDSYVAVGE